MEYRDISSTSRCIHAMRYSRTSKSKNITYYPNLTWERACAREPMSLVVDRKIE